MLFFYLFIFWVHTEAAKRQEAFLYITFDCHDIYKEGMQYILLGSDLTKIPARIVRIANSNNLVNSI